MTSERKSQRSDSSAAGAAASSASTRESKRNNLAVEPLIIPWINTPSDPVDARLWIDRIERKSSFLADAIQNEPWNDRFNHMLPTADKKQREEAEKAAGVLSSLRSWRGDRPGTGIDDTHDLIQMMMAGSLPHVRNQMQKRFKIPKDLEHWSSEAEAMWTYNGRNSRAQILRKCSGIGAGRLIWVQVPIVPARGISTTNPAAYRVFSQIIGLAGDQAGMIVVAPARARVCVIYFRCIIFIFVCCCGGWWWLRGRGRDGTDSGNGCR